MTQRVLNMKHLGWRGLRGAAANAARLALRGQTNFLRMLWKFNGVYNADLLIADHARPVPYEMAPPPPIIPHTTLDPKSLYHHAPRGRRGRATANATARAVGEEPGGG